jgi:hypothetical protein
MIRKMDNLETLKMMLVTLEDDLTKFYSKGNKAASIRARKTLQDIKAQAQNIRVHVSKTRKENEK